MAVLRIGVVSFNQREADAVDALLDDLTNESAWSRHGSNGVSMSYPREVVIDHHPLRAQGNVIAAARMAELLGAHQRQPDLLVFYGCAGAVDPANVGSAFLVGSVSYLSLGTVDVESTFPYLERVTLKNKWLCHVAGADAEPLETVTFNEVISGPALGLAASKLTPCHVIATDKVVRIGPSGVAPAPQAQGPPHAVYSRGEWSYADGLAYVSDARTDPVLVEMESYGIGAVSKALRLENRVVIIRIATDDLVGHANSDEQQAQLLYQGRLALLSVVHALVFPHQEVA